MLEEAKSGYTLAQIMPSEVLEGKTVLVTGGAGGLGKHIATRYLEAGANVAICDINDKLLASVNEYLGPTGRFLAVKADITEEAAMQALVDEIVTKFGRLDILVNNAGVMDRFDPVADLSRDMWDNVLNVNLTGSFLGAKVAVNTFLKQEPKGGTILQIGSNASYSGHMSGLAYSVSKHGVQGLVKHTASYYGDQAIYCIGLLLGAMPDTNISTAMQATGINKEGYSNTVGISPVQASTVIRLDDVAKYAIFLADRSVARSANGSLITFTANWPKA